MKKILRRSDKGFIQVSGNYAECRGHCVITRINHAPFPLKSAALRKKFFDIHSDERLGHTSKRGGVYWGNQTYNDNRVLIAIPNHFDANKPFHIILFLHGNQSLLERDLIHRQKIPQQLFASNANAILIAPQLAKDALDSSAGNFESPNFAQEFLVDTAKKIKRIFPEQFKSISHTQLANNKLILLAYSGGYLATAKIIEQGNIAHQINGIILLDALYGEEKIFTDFISRQNRSSFLFSCYTEPAREANEKFLELIKAKSIEYTTQLAGYLSPGKVIVWKLNEKISHWDLLTKGWKKNCVTDLLNRIR